MPGKKGGNKGIAAAKKQRKREEAEARNARTPYEPDMNDLAKAEAEGVDVENEAVIYFDEKHTIEEE